MSEGMKRGRGRPKKVFDGSERWELILQTAKVEALRGIARKIAYEQSCDFTWNDAVRSAVDDFLSKHGAMPAGPKAGAK